MRTADRAGDDSVEENSAESAESGAAEAEVCNRSVSGARWSDLRSGDAKRAARLEHDRARLLCCRDPAALVTNSAPMRVKAEVWHGANCQASAARNWT